MSKKAIKDLDRAVKAFEEWKGSPTPSLDFHLVRAEQKMLELCLNFVIEHCAKVRKLLEQGQAK